jgi:NAD(P)-dependent dehydrogenase (short-subunit alcohol dehydrogenase family)
MIAPCASGSERVVSTVGDRRQSDDGNPPVLRLFGLDGRVALVTGASSGLGAAVARTLAAAGARVAVSARRHDRLAALADEIGGTAVDGDLLDPAQVDALVPQVVEALGGPEILVNAAGTFAGACPAEDEPIRSVTQALNLNLVAPFRLSQAVFPHMRAAGRGAIVNVSSISGQVGIPGIPQASYAAAKAGLSGLTSELAVQWARHAIRVNTVAPGFFRSEITEGMYDDERSRAWLRRNTPLPYDGTVDDFVGAVLWLASDAGRFVTGQTIVVDGGWTAR